jgi:HK97 family phage prohead protease
MEHLASAFTVQSASPDTGTFRGMASVFNTLIDTWVPTRIKPGAFANTIVANKSRIKVLYQHNADWPIGVPTKMEETERGLYVEAKISPTTMGTDVLQLLRDKVITELSIGFDPVRVEMVNETINGVTVQVRHLREVQLWEFSPVTFAANRDAVVSAVHRRARGSDHIDRQLQALDRLAADLRDAELRSLERDWHHAHGDRRALTDVVRDVTRVEANRDDALRRLTLDAALHGINTTRRS